MDPRVDEYLAQEYPLTLYVDETQEGDKYAVALLDVPGCIAQGRTIEEAQERLESIKPAFFAQLLQVGADIPMPSEHPAILPGQVGIYDNRTGMVSALGSQAYMEDALFPREAVA